jgi:hypothetical protein
MRRGHGEGTAPSRDPAVRPRPMLSQCGVARPVRALTRFNLRTG